MTAWTPVTPKFTNEDYENYEATADWVSFDCECMDVDQPGYDSLPYDFDLRRLGSHTLTCPRCGRIYKVSTRLEVVVHVPVDVQYPNLTKLPPETLGLRDKEDPDGLH